MDKLPYCLAVALVMIYSKVINLGGQKVTITGCQDGLQVVCADDIPTLAIYVVWPSSSNPLGFPINWLKTTADVAA